MDETNYLYFCLFYCTTDVENGGIQRSKIWLIMAV